MACPYIDYASVSRNEESCWTEQIHQMENVDGLVQDCSNSSALTMQLLQSGTKPSIYIV